MHCIVIVREIWDTRDLVGPVINADGTVNESSLTNRFEPEDLNALEMALKIKDKNGAKVTALALGQPRSLDVLRECLYRDVDAVQRVDVPDLKNADTAVFADLIAGAIRKIGACDLVLAGIDIAEGENSLLGAHVAAALGIEQATYVDVIEDIQNDKVVCKRQIENGYEVVEMKLPALVVVGVALLKDDPRTPRTAKATLKLKHKKTAIPQWNAAEVGIQEPGRSKVTALKGYEAIAQRVIDSKQVDANDEAALKSMLEEIRKGG